MVSKTSFNKRYTLRRPFRRLRASSRLGHFASLHSHASLQPHFASPGLAPQALIRAGKTSYICNVKQNAGLAFLTKNDKEMLTTVKTYYIIFFNI